ncbi:MAG TPA: carboxylesterase family protein [Roseiarcus sp.]
MAKRRLAIVIAAVLGLSTHSPFVGEARADGPACAAGSTIALEGGSTVCGVAANRPGVFIYKGLAYATAGRWQAPVPAQWPPVGELMAVQFGPICPQDDPPQPSAEDCLYLNIWAPENAINGARSLPVMLFIHGGAFVKGRGSSPLYDGSAFAARGAVVVTFNYRLGALGFLSANALGSGEIGGNFGLMDQQAAMAWVQRNIAPFGGDPKRVTLFGESAGAMSVGLHTFDVPSSGPLFAAALMESNPLGIQYLTPVEAGRRGGVFLKALCDGVNASDGASRCPGNPTWAAKAPVAAILKAQTEATGRLERSIGLADLRLSALIERILEVQSMPWAPVVDGKLVVGEPYAGYAPETRPFKPMAFGVNADEGPLFVARAYPRAPWDFTSLAYRGFLALRFGLRSAAILRDPRYSPDALVAPPYYSAAGAAYANLMTDFVFVCGNLSAANAALTQSPAPAFGYRFAQAPFADLYGRPPDTVADFGACAPAGAKSNVCHGAELPYVFDTLDAMATANDRPGPSDRRLAEEMNAAWFAFAENPAAPGKPWIAYDGHGHVLQWSGDGNAAADLDRPASCSALWLHALPYRGTAAGSRR